MRTARRVGELFQQAIVPLPRGRVRYRVDRAGPLTRDGRRVSTNFAACWEAGRWVVTHLPSGREVPGAGRPRLAEVTHVARQLEDAGACGRKRVSQKTIRRMKRVLGFE